MPEGALIMTVTCLACGHTAEMRPPEDYGPALKRRMRCTACGALGQVETVVSWQPEGLDFSRG